MDLSKVNLERVLSVADEIRMKNRDIAVCSGHVVLALYRDNLCKIDDKALKFVEDSLEKGEMVRAAEQIPWYVGRDILFGMDPNAITVGRDAELERIINILMRKKKSNPMLVGKPGVGKTVIVEELARRIFKGGIMELEGYRVVEVILPNIVADASLRGAAEKRVQRIIEEAENRNIILFVDEAHVIFGGGSLESNMISNLMKPALARGKMKVIAATTQKEYKRIESDGALSRRFTKVTIPEMSVEGSIAVIKKSKSEYEKFFNVEIAPSVVDRAVTLSEKYIHGKFHPDKDVEVLDTAMSMKRRATPSDNKYKAIERLIGGTKLDLTEEDVDKVIAEMSGVPMERLSASDIDSLSTMDKEVKQVVVGQDEAVDSICKEVTKFRLGLRGADRPISFLFIGRTGTGKTKLAQEVATKTFGNKDAMVRFDMSEFSQPHTKSRLIGSPPGYVGWNEGGELTEKVKNNPYSMVLFDEVEKAHPDVATLLLQILSEGRLTDGNGETINFTKCICVLTTNVGSEVYLESPIGYGKDNMKSEKVRKSKLLDRIRDRFPPEFVGRVDYMITFNAEFTEEQMKKVVELEIAKVAQETGYDIKSDVGALVFFTKFYDEKEGFRSVSKTVREKVTDVIFEVMKAALPNEPPKEIVLLYVHDKKDPDDVKKGTITWKK